MSDSGQREAGVCIGRRSLRRVNLDSRANRVDANRLRSRRGPESLFPLEISVRRDATGLHAPWGEQAACLNARFPNTFTELRWTNRRVVGGKERDARKFLYRLRFRLVGNSFPSRRATPSSNFDFDCESPTSRVLSRVLFREESVRGSRRNRANWNSQSVDEIMQGYRGISLQNDRRTVVAV